MLAPQGIFAMLASVIYARPPMTGVEKLLKKESGSASAVAAKLTAEDREGRDCTRQLVEYWAEQGYVTPKWAPVVNRVYEIPLHELNPAVYPRREHVAA